MKNKYILLKRKSTKTFRTKGIDLNKVTKPVLDKAIIIAENYKYEIFREKLNELKKATSPEKIRRIYQEYYQEMKKIEDTSLNGINSDYIVVPTGKEALLEYLSRKYLNMHPDYGVEIILDAYQYMLALDAL